MQGFPYKPGYNVAEFLLETLVEGSAFSLADSDGEDQSADVADKAEAEARAQAEAHVFAVYYEMSSLHAENQQKVTSVQVVGDQASRNVQVSVGALGFQLLRYRVSTGLSDIKLCVLYVQMRWYIIPKLAPG